MTAASHFKETAINYFPFHIGDYVSATRHLSWEEDAAYRRLLDTYYLTEKPLPADIRQVCRLVLATTDSQREAVEIVLGEFFQLTDAGWSSERADREICAMQGKQEKQREKANTRWEKYRQEHGNALAMPRHNETDATALNNDADAMPPTPTPTPTPLKEKRESASRRKAQISLPDGFEPNASGIESAKAKGAAIQTEIEKFKNFHLSKGSTMSDWQAAWRTWVGNARGTVPVVADSSAKPGTDEYFRANKDAKWWRDAGFSDVYDAHNGMCWHHNAGQFRDGKRAQVAA